MKFNLIFIYPNTHKQKNKQNIMLEDKVQNYTPPTLINI